MTIKQATIRGQAIKVQFAPLAPNEPPVETLFVDIAIECPDCGTHQVRFAGHHLRTLRNLLIEFIDLHPTLCGEEEKSTVRERLEYSGQPPQDPSAN